MIHPDKMFANPFLVMALLVIMVTGCDDTKKPQPPLPSVEPSPVVQEVEGPGESKPAMPMPTMNGHTIDPLVIVQKRVADETAVLIDVREQGEWDAGHLSQAKLVPLSQLQGGVGQAEYAAKLAETLPKDKVIYCHCRSGGRVLVAAPILRDMGYDVRPLKAGYTDLVEAGFSNADSKAASP
jgi:phage shock protein E